MKWMLVPASRTTVNAGQLRQDIADGVSLARPGRAVQQYAPPEVLTRSQQLLPVLGDPDDLALDALEHAVRQYDVCAGDAGPRVQPERPDALPELVALERHHLPPEHVVLFDQLRQCTE